MNLLFCRKFPRENLISRPILRVSSINHSLPHPGFSSPNATDASARMSVCLSAVTSKSSLVTEMRDVRGRERSRKRVRKN